MFKRLLLTGLLVATFGAGCDAADDIVYVPEVLKPWVPWVMDRKDERACAHSTAEERVCAWPGRMDITITSHGGTFRAEVQIDARQALVLPGGPGAWPQNVSVDGERASVIGYEDRPQLELPPGRHVVSGTLSWRQRPEALPLPPGSGLLKLVVDGQAITSPVLTRDGALWLTDKRDTRSDEARLQVKVFRRLIDEVPFQIETRIDLDVAGAAREVVLPGALLPGTELLALESQLSTRVEADRGLRVQIKPGRHHVVLMARHRGSAPDKLALPLARAPWPNTEIWVFDARQVLRQIALQGVAPIDPRQAGVPKSWQHFPAFRMTPGAALALVEQRRGEVEPEPNALSLRRDLWLDFDGDGYTLTDRISGRMGSGWRLNATPALQLGRAVQQGRPQLLTVDDNGHQGFEVRRRDIEVDVDARIGRRLRQLPVTGWQHDFQQVNATVHLPPGWRVWSVSRVDNVPETWLHRWTLLDLFLVLITAIAVARLFNWRWGLLAVLCLGLIWHEANAPQFVWLHVIAALALRRLLPPGRLRQLIEAYRWVAFAALAAIAIPFVVDQARLGLFPQLEFPHIGAEENKRYATLPTEAAYDAEEDASAVDMVETGAAESSQVTLSAQKSGASIPPAANEPDGFAGARKKRPPQAAPPNPLIQTGPGVPRWRWREFHLRWNGPILAGQEFTLLLTSPRVNSLLSLLHVLGVAGLALLLLRALPLRLPQRASSTASLCLLAILAGYDKHASAAEIPAAPLLEELKARLNRPPACMPYCADFTRLHIHAQQHRLDLHLTVDSLAYVALPLPDTVQQWQAAEVTLNGESVPTLRRDSGGRLLLGVPAGAHEIILSGPPPERDRFQIVLPDTPRLVTTELDGWLLEGLRDDGTVDRVLSFARRASKQSAPDEPLNASTVPPFFVVARTLDVGRQWRVATHVRRLSAPGRGARVAVPLLPGEAVTSDGVTVTGGKAIINFSPTQRHAQWQSILHERASLDLSAPRDVPWVETWSVALGEDWQLTATGLPNVHGQDDGGRWRPQWRPWPGETLGLHFAAPDPAPGATTTIDHSKFNGRVGTRATDYNLRFQLRASHGGQQKLVLPATADVQVVRINGIAQALARSAPEVTIAVVPGVQDVLVEWREARGVKVHYTSSTVDLGMASVNATIAFELPRDRWVLWLSGPALGPAVLFWGVLFIIALLAVALARTGLTPLGVGQWLLLGVGLSQVPILQAIVIVVWLLAIGARQRLPVAQSKTWFNLSQVLIALGTIAVLVLLFDAIRRGLLGAPGMQVMGNGSSAYEPRWFADRIAAAYPTATVISVPIIVYRALMLAWALWLAFALLNWLRWGWRVFSRDGLWRNFTLLRAGPQKPSTHA